MHWYKLTSTPRIGGFPLPSRSSVDSDFDDDKTPYTKSMCGTQSPI